MKLRFSPTSPYVRKVVVTARELGIDDRIERIPTNPWVGDSELAADNPLGKVPVLITDDGLTLYDSPVICEYLDREFGGSRLLPLDGAARWTVLRQQALCDGILDAAILRRLENQRPLARQSVDWCGLQADAVAKGLDALERAVGDWDEAVDLGQIAAGCALGYLDFRFAEDLWRATRPTLAAWYEQFAARPAMQATVPQEPAG
jgi:glutathione S-transferase